MYLHLPSRSCFEIHLIFYDCSFAMRSQKMRCADNGSRRSEVVIQTMQIESWVVIIGGSSDLQEKKEQSLLIIERISPSRQKNNLNVLFCRKSGLQTALISLHGGRNINFIEKTEFCRSQTTIIRKISYPITTGSLSTIISLLYFQIQYEFYQSKRSLLGFKNDLLAIIELVIQFSEHLVPHCHQRKVLVALNLSHLLDIILVVELVILYPLLETRFKRETVLLKPVSPELLGVHLYLRNLLFLLLYLLLFNRLNLFLLFFLFLFSGFRSFGNVLFIPFFLLKIRIQFISLNWIQQKFFRISHIKMHIPPIIFFPLHF